MSANATSHVHDISALGHNVGARTPPKIAQSVELANTSTEFPILIHQPSMAASNENQTVDVGSGSGISARLADAARDEVLGATIQPVGEKPVTFVGHQAETRAASNEFLQVCTYL